MSGPKPRRSLHLPTPSRGDQQILRSPRRRRGLRWKPFLIALLLEALGVGLLVGLLQLPERLDTVLLISQALANLIGGVQRLVVGLVQLVALVLLVGLAVAALVLVVAGLVRLVRSFGLPPGPGPQRRPPRSH